MPLLFGPSPEDRAHLVSAARSLRMTSIAGLSAALSWSERKTERVVRELVHRREPGLLYDPIRRTVAVHVPHSAPAASSGTPRPGVADGPKLEAPPLPTGVATRKWGGGVSCPTCGGPMTPTGSGGTIYCPNCGRLTSAPSAVGTPATVAAPVAPSLPAPAEDAAPSLGERKAQEMLAAWVTSKPIPCPKCRTPLRHRGVGVYGCPACGEIVKFHEGKVHRNLAAPPAA